MARKKKNNLNMMWVLLIVAALALFLITRTSSPEAGLNVEAKYYDENMNEVFLDESQSIFDFQTILSPTKTVLPYDVHFVQLYVDITNTGNLNTTARIDNVKLLFFPETYSSTPVSQLIEPGQTGRFQTDLINVGDILGSNKVMITFSIFDESQEFFITDEYHWLFTIPKAPDGASCTLGSECEGNYCVDFKCNSRSFISGDGRIHSGENCGNSVDAQCSYGQVCSNGACIVMPCDPGFPSCPNDGDMNVDYCFGGDVFDETVTYSCQLNLAGTDHVCIANYQSVLVLQCSESCFDGRCIGGSGIGGGGGIGGGIN